MFDFPSEKLALYIRMGAQTARGRQRTLFDQQLFDKQAWRGQNTEEPIKH